MMQRICRAGSGVPGMSAATMQYMNICAHPCTAADAPCVVLHPCSSMRSSTHASIYICRCHASVTKRVGICHTHMPYMCHMTCQATCGTCVNPQVQNTCAQKCFTCAIGVQTCIRPPIHLYPSIHTHIESVRLPCIHPSTHPYTHASPHPIHHPCMRACKHCVPTTRCAV